MESLAVKAGTGVIVIKNGKVLTGIRQGSHGAGQRAFPGGHVDPTDRSLAEAGEREVLEETGIRCKVRTLWPNDGVDLASTFKILSDDGSKRYVTVYLVADYLDGGTTKEDGSIVPLEPHKCSRWEWHTLEELRDLVVTQAPDQVWIPIERIAYNREILGL